MKARTAARIAREVQSRGIYSLPAAAALLGERPSTVHRWALGYRRRGKSYAAAIRTDVPELQGVNVLTFLELVELLFIQGLLRTGLSWPKVREASRVAAELLANDLHPFASRHWFVDAAALYLQLGEEHDEPLLIEMAGHGQTAMKPVLTPYLKQLEFDARGEAQRWYPMGLAGPVVLDPRRSFGMPVVSRGGVPTEALFALYRAGDSVDAIAAWYRIEQAEVEAALSFEEKLQSAA